MPAEGVYMRVGGLYSEQVAHPKESHHSEIRYPHQQNRMVHQYITRLSRTNSHTHHIYLQTPRPNIPRPNIHIWVYEFAISV